jgi:tRNA(Ile)-lysidine synthase
LRLFLPGRFDPAFFIPALMKEKFYQILQSNKWSGKRIVVGVSGGADSMVLAHLLHVCGSELVIAHCNFGLRGAESDQDETMVQDWARSRQIPFHSVRFSTREVLNEKGGNLQETARNLRYDWFQQLKAQLGFDYIATAHHVQDSVETMLINFFKGTGIAGLHGIMAEQDSGIIRPLLSFYKEEILNWAAENNLPWREDSSNRKNDYTRNAVRNKLLPVVSEIFPGAVQHLAANIQRMQEVEMLYRQAVAKQTAKLIEQRGASWYLPVKKWKHVQPLGTLLWETLRPFGFTHRQLPDLIRLLAAETGRFIQSATHQALRNRDFIVVSAAASTQSDFIMIHEGTDQVEAPGCVLEIRYRDPNASPDWRKAEKEEFFLDADRLQFPLILRPWRTGDYFYPFGMQLKKKKVSRFLISEKVSLQDKRNIWVLESGKRLMGVLGMRADERFKITEKTKKICYIKFRAKVDSQPGL